MRQPRPADVLAAVEYVTGTDPMNHGHDSRRSSGTRLVAKRLACHCLAQICDLNHSAIGRVLHIDRSTAKYHLGQPFDHETAKMVVQRISDQLEAEQLETLRQRSERRAMLEAL